jgi:hypothetical protein
VPAPVQLGRGARGEDPQHRDLLLPRVDAGARDHADVADDGAVGAAHRDREVSVERVAHEEAVAGEAGDRAGRVADHVALGDRFARRAGELVLVALRQQVAAGPAGEDARAGRRVGQLRDVRHEASVCMASLPSLQLAGF